MDEKKTSALFQPDPIECDIVDGDGNTRHLVAQVRVTKKNLKVYASWFDEADKMRLTEPERVQAFLCAKIYGGVEEDYENFEIRVLKGAVNFFNQKNAVPTLTVGA
jgi:hypothetical protein